MSPKLTRKATSARFSTFLSHLRVDMRGARRRRSSVGVVAAAVATGACLVFAGVAWAAPETMITSAPPAFTSSPNAAFQFTASEPVARFECKLDAAATFTECSSPHAVSGLSEGAHTLAVRAVSGAAGPDPTPATHAWTVDLTSPDTTFSAAPPPLTSSTGATFAFTSEAGSSFECSLSGAAFSACGSPQSLTGLSEGTRTFAVRAIDQAGNVDPSPAVSTWTVDVTPPDTTITSGPSGPSNASAPSFGFASEAAATFECSRDGAPFSGCVSPLVMFSGLAQGPHTLNVRAVDPGGNIDPTPASRSWQKDTVGPPAPGLFVKPCRLGEPRGVCLPPLPRRGTSTSPFQTQANLLVRWFLSSATGFDVGYSRYSYPARSSGPTDGDGGLVLWKSNVATTSSPFAATSGGTYCFVSKARDSLGNEGPSTEERCTTLPYRATALASGGLSKKRGAGHYLGQYVQGKEGQLNLRLGKQAQGSYSREVPVKRVALVVTKCKGCGKVSVALYDKTSEYPTLEGVWPPVFIKTLNLKASETYKKRVIEVWTVRNPRQVDGFLVIKPVGGKEVKIEGVGVAPK